ncbi:MAG: flagellar basal body-associated FliL family protein [Alphaproteobacteria bacterium]|nr:flagellar basal body-associated FliL family protein [Alphaproteobacteria bacterium]
MAKKQKPEDKEGADDATEEKEASATEGGEGTGEGSEGGGEGGAAKKSKKKLIIIAAAAVVLLGGGAGAYFTMMGGGGGHTEEEEKPQEVVYYSMPEMIINLATSTKQASFLKARIILELPNKLDAITVEANLPRLMDAFNTYVRELRPSDLSGSAGITRLREELLLRANKALEPTKVNDVLFKEIVVQ